LIRTDDFPAAVWPVDCWFSGAAVFLKSGSAHAAGNSIRAAFKNSDFKTLYRLVFESRFDYGLLADIVASSDAYVFADAHSGIDTADPWLVLSRDRPVEPTVGLVTEQLASMGTQVYVSHDMDAVLGWVEHCKMPTDARFTC
jgi:hypothetical protein